MKPESKTEWVFNGIAALSHPGSHGGRVFQADKAFLKWLHAVLVQIAGLNVRLIVRADDENPPKPRRWIVVRFKNGKPY